MNNIMRLGLKQVEETVSHLEKRPAVHLVIVCMSEVPARILQHSEAVSGKTKYIVYVSLSAGIKTICQTLFI